MKNYAMALVLTCLSWTLACSDDGNKACTGSNDPEELNGSFCEGSEIEFNTVQIGFQELTGELRIRFAQDEDGTLTPRLDVIVASDQLVLEPNVSIGFGTVAFVRWRPSAAADWQQLTNRLAPTSNLTFDAVSTVPGSAVSGQFALLIDNSRTLNSRFSGTLVDL